MAQPAPKSKRVKSKEDIAKAAKGNIPEFEFFTSDGNVVVLQMLNRNGRVLITGETHERFVELCAAREAGLAAVGADKFDIKHLTAIVEAVDDAPAVDEEEPGLYETAADKRIAIFRDNQEAVIGEVSRLIGCAAFGVRDHAKLKSAPVDRQFYYQAITLIVDRADEAIPDEYRDEVNSDWNEPEWMDQNFEEVRDFVDSFRGRVGL